jgi:hypothetical protein
MRLFAMIKLSRLVGKLDAFFYIVVTIVPFAISLGMERSFALVTLFARGESKD